MYLDDEYERELADEARRERWQMAAYHNQLMRHPDPRDPDYPGPDDDYEEE
jgi:hypothetical protein